jgi:hypothetical protein
VDELRERGGPLRLSLPSDRAKMPLDQLNNRPTEISVKRPERIEHLLRQGQRDQL